MSHQQSSRIFGIILVCGGVALTFYQWHTALSKGYFSGLFAALGPLLICTGIDVMIETPELPIDKASPLMKVMMIVGCLLGALNWYLLSQ